MNQAADPGCVAPGTQKPIHIFFVVSRTESDPNVIEFGPQGLADLFRGTEDRIRGGIDSEYAIFTDKTSADDFAKRQKLIVEGIRYLRSLEVEQLEEVVPALGKDKIEDTIESINVTYYRNEAERYAYEVLDEHSEYRLGVKSKIVMDVLDRLYEMDPCGRVRRDAVMAELAVRRCEEVEMNYVKQ